MENKFDGSRRTATEICMMQYQRDVFLRSMVDSFVLGLRAYKVDPVYFWKDIKLDKKKKIKLEETVAGCQDKLGTLEQCLSGTQRRMARIEYQELPGMRTIERSLRDDVASLRGCVKHNAEALEKRILALEQAHCDHDYEIVGGKVSQLARIHKAVHTGIFHAPTVDLKCTKCGKTEVRELTPAVEPEPKRSWWYKFKAWAAPTSFGVE